MKGICISDHADDECDQPLLAQYYEDSTALFLTIYDVRLRKLVTIQTHAGAEGFLRATADLIDEPPIGMEQLRLQQEVNRLRDELHVLQTGEFLRLHNELSRLQNLLRESEIQKDGALREVDNQLAQVHVFRERLDGMEVLLDQWANGRPESYASYRETLEDLISGFGVLQSATEVLREDNARLEQRLARAETLLVKVNHAAENLYNSLGGPGEELAAYCGKFQQSEPRF